MVTGGVDYSTVDYGYDNTYDADGTSTRPESTSTYELLPSDAFAPTTTRKSRRFAIIAAACIVILGVIAIGAYTAFAGGGDDSSASPTASAPAPAPADRGSTDAACPARTVGNVTTGSDAGGSGSGIDVIKAFNYAYYVKRDAQAVSEFVVPAARRAVIPSIANLQMAIDDLPKGTTHCLTITDLGNGLHKVDLAQIAPGPGGQRTVFHQMIQTTSENGRWLIVSNTAVG
ncbi:hypothetical protein [Gordonia sp. (in: high G+C Gram-positive bacteria)]|uniref:hypothetical protein n=1 Tax=Gordonia sp. (in: high G+C Gram-positive bacteria) TaxID=84139 RepID=UPI003C78314D